MADDWSAASVEAFLHQRIPMAKAMDLRVEQLEEGSVTLHAPLAANHNHLGTAFGGSLAAVATLAGYVALWTSLEDREVHVVVRRSEIDYLQPVHGDLHATCKLPDGKLREAFCRTFHTKGKARLKLAVTIHEAAQECVRFQGEFVAIRSE